MVRGYAYRDECIGKNHTWDTVDLSLGKSIVGCKWVYTVKLKVDGSVDRYKAHLVTKRVYPNVWNQLSWNICSNCKNEFHTYSDLLGCPQRLTFTSTWCKKCFSLWGFERSVYETSFRFSPFYCQRKCMQIKKIIVWVKTIPKGVVWKVQFCYA